jgi:hypothetical protein
LYTSFSSQDGADQEFGREPEPQRAVTYYGKSSVHAIEHSLDTHDGRSPTIDFELSFQEVQTPQQPKIFTCGACKQCRGSRGGERGGLDDNERFGAQKEKH